MDLYAFYLAHPVCQPVNQSGHPVGRDPDHRAGKRENIVGLVSRRDAFNDLADGRDQARLSDPESALSN